MFESVRYGETAGAWIENVRGIKGIMLEVKHLSKKFDGNYVLKDVSLSIGDGEVYGLIGANGSGKSTFMNILNGNEVIVKSGGYEGQILVDGKAVSIGSHSESVGYGIAMVHQELALFAGMTVTENIKINRENIRGRQAVVPELSLIDGKQNREDARKTLERIGSDLDPDQKIDGLSLNQKQFVELARELDNKKVRFLMLDEPTSSLNITETQGLLRCIRDIADSGISVLFISHRLEEITEVCDRVSVLRDGELISTYNREAFDVHRFADDMVGREIVKARRQKKDGVQKTVFSYENIGGTENRLDVREGEILGITGLAGQGQDRLMDGLFGLKSGDCRVSFKGAPISLGDNRELIRQGIYYLSEDRSHTSLCLDSPIWKNMIFGTELRHREFLRLPACPALSLLDKKKVESHVQSMIETLNIVCRSADQKARELSGGNQQKVCVGRALTFQPEMLFVGEPTRGIDVYSKELILQWLIKMNQEFKTTVVVASGELEEMIRICDRIAVMYQGQVYKVFEGDIRLEELTLALYGRDMDEK